MRKTPVKAMINDLKNSRLLLAVISLAAGVVPMLRPDVLWVFVIGAVCLVCALFFLMQYFRCACNPYCLIKKYGTELSEEKLAEIVDEDCLDRANILFYGKAKPSASFVLITKNYLIYKADNIFIAPTDSILWVQYRETFHQEMESRYSRRVRASHGHITPEVKSFYLIVHTVRTESNRSAKFEMEFNSPRTPVETLEALSEHFSFPLGKDIMLEYLSENDRIKFERECLILIKIGDKPKISVF